MHEDCCYDAQAQMVALVHVMGMVISRAAASLSRNRMWDQLFASRTGLSQFKSSAKELHAKRLLAY